MMEECGYFVDIIKNMDRERMCMYTHTCTDLCLEWKSVHVDF